MGTKTEYYEFNLPANDDYADQNKFNENFQTLDSVLHTMQGEVDSTKQVPAVGANDDGKVLTASYSDDTGSYAWATPSGGGGGTTDYSDLTNKPQINSVTLSGNKSLSDLGLAAAADIPTVPITEFQKNNTTISPVSGVVNITVPTSAADVSALPASTKYAAALSLTINSSTYVITGQLKDQDGNNLGTAQTIDLPLESVVVNGSYNSQTKKVVLTLQNGNTIEFSVADLVSGLQTELSANNKLNPAYIDYDSTHRAVSDDEKSAWNAKQAALTQAQLAAVNSGITSARLTADESNIAWNTNNGVKNLSPTAGGTVASGGRVAKMPCNIPAGTYVMGWLSTATSGSAVITFYKNGTQIAQGGFGNSTTYNTTSITLTDVANEIELYTNTANTISDVMICPKSLYDADSTYEPYALPNTKITPELIDLVDSGAKNLLPINNGTATQRYWINVTLPAGDYVIYVGSISSTDTDRTRCQLLAVNGNTVVSDYIYATRENDKFYEMSLSGTCDAIYVYASESYALSAGDTVAFSNLMICSKAAWDVSNKFVPYRPSYDELIARVEALENA